MAILLETPSNMPGETPTPGGAAAQGIRAVGRQFHARGGVSPMCRAVVGWACLALVAGDLRAQFLEPDPAFKSKRTDVVKIMREDKPIPPGEQQMFDDFFRLYAIPQFAAKENLSPNPKAEEKPGAATSARPVAAGGLPKVRSDFRSRYITQAAGANGPPHQRANQLTLEKFKELLRIKAPADATPEVQSQIAAIKINVVLALGEMNEQETGNNQKAKPLPQALAMLLTIFNAKSADGKTSGNADALRIAALVGIQRHADSDSLTPEVRGNIQQTMLALVKQKQAPDGRSPEIHNLLRRRAAMTLGTLGDVGPNGAVTKTLDAVIADPSEPPKVRAEMAAALGMFKAVPETRIDFKALANHIGWLMIDVGRPETSAAGDAESATAWRRFRSCVKDGLEGLTLAVTVTEPNQRKFVEGVVAKAKLLDKTLDNGKKLENFALAKSVNEKIKELEAALEPRVAAPKAADPRPVAPASPAKKPGKETSAQVKNTPKPPAGRPPRVDESVSVDQRATDAKPGTVKGAEDIEPTPD